MKSTLKILEEHERLEVVEQIIALEKFWAKRSSTLYTLGAIAYLEAYADESLNVCFNKMGNFYAHQQLINPVLSRRFAALYQKITTELSKVLNAPVELCPELPHPGFQMIFITQEYAEKIAMMDPTVDRPPIHVDQPYRAYLPFWDQFKEIDWEDTLTFTLPIELPKEGSGLHMWSKIPTSELDRLRPLGSAGLARRFGPCLETMEYTPGVMSYFIGHYLHQIKQPKNLSPSDRRFTCQGHGVKCDGVWKLYV
jgi:hypothetical protein